MTDQPDMVEALSAGAPKPPRKRVTLHDGAAAFWIGLAAAVGVFVFFNSPRLLYAFAAFFAVAVAIYAGRRLGGRNGG